MEVVQTLVRSVMRAFYSVTEILAVDALVTHSALRDDELAYLMKMNLKDLHKLCASLRDARFLTVHVRPEMQAGKTRPINRTYYFIDYRQTIDAIKWRVYKTDKDMQSVVNPADESKEYFCPRCQAQWSQLEVLDSVSMSGFTCQRCSSVLELSKEREAPGHQQLSRMNNQFKFMTDMLQKIDQTVVPECTFDKAIAVARPVVREVTHEVLTSIPVDVSFSKPSAVKGLAHNRAKTMSVTISDGNSEQENLENKKRKERLLAENALPIWMTTSSVPVQTQSDAMDEDKDEDGGAPAKRVKLEDAAPAVSGGDEMSVSFTNVKAEGGDEDEDDDFEFEDVI